VTTDLSPNPVPAGHTGPLPPLLVATAADAVTAPPLLMFSLKSNHSAPIALKGAALTRPAFVFVRPGPTAVQSVVFTLDPGTPTAIRAQRSAPFDFGATDANGKLLPLAASGLATGKHQMTAAYFVHNNVWNPPSGGSQKISVGSERSWFVEAKNFPNDNFEVFSYPNVHRDLPNYPKGGAVSSFSTVKTTFAGVPQAKGNFNVAYDIWLNGVGNGNGSTELMIWTETRPQTLQPLGTDQGDFTINGVGYDVYRYTSGGINVVSYKARSTVRSGTFDLKQIIGDGVSRGFVPANPRLSSVDYGVEYRFTDGTARFDVSDFSLTTS
jgi:hypothetical protein